MKSAHSLHRASAFAGLAGEPNIFGGGAAKATKRPGMNVMQHMCMCLMPDMPVAGAPEVSL